MKKPSMNKSLARIAASLFLSTLFFLHAGVTTAQSLKADSPANVTFIGSQDGGYIFDVTFENNAGDTYYVAVVDQAGNTLFKGIYADKKFDKKFKLPAGEEINNVSFVIRDLNSKTSFTYAVGTQQRSVEDVIVKRTN